jgi:hypothetical protein
MLKKTIAYLVLLFLTLLCSADLLSGFEIDTHRMLNGIAINQPVGDGADAFDLKTFTYYPLEFGISNDKWVGRYPNITWEMVQGWIKGGGAWEDDFPRYLNHFHDPLQPSDQAGIRILGYPVFTSSVVWAQKEKGTQYAGNYSWHDARDYCYKALSGTTPAERAKWFQETFRALGQIMHLVEDAAVPDHTRNDFWHGPKAYFLNANTFERWTDSHLDIASSLPIPSFSKEQANQLLGQRGDDQAPVPISRLFDTNLYVPGERPNITGDTLAGIAEYSNSNFLSDATIFNDYVYPSLDSTEPSVDIGYLRKVRDGEAIEHFVTGEKYRGSADYELDPICYRDYASLLLPKATAYASLVPYYFFRAFIQLREFPFNPPPPGPAVFEVYNDSSEIIDGQLELYALSDDGNQSLLGSYSIKLLPCTKNEDGRCVGPYERIVVSPYMCQAVVAVFRGTLGQEEDAVVASDLSGGCAM